MYGKMKIGRKDRKAVVKDFYGKDATRFDPIVRRIEQLKRIEKRDNIYTSRLLAIRRARRRKELKSL